MQLRDATPQDKSTIIDILKLSLGESTIPKSELLWNWKHELNPFGHSFVLLAEENGKLVGVRAFMQWEWEWKGQIYKAIRAVDTATHPDHQGKGIFKKLTLQQVAICKQQGISFVFNTPNNQSKPGYLKMGWVEQGKLPLKFKLLRPLSMAFRQVIKQNKLAASDYYETSPQAWGNGITDLVNKIPKRTEQIRTHLFPQYISWRYEKNPLFKYHYFTDERNFLLISRIKTHPFGLELRLVEFIFLNPGSDLRKLNREIKLQVMEFCKENKIDFISLSGLEYSSCKACCKWMGMLPVRLMGPTITLKDINMNEKFPYLLQLNNWRYSLGDLELF